MTELSEVPFMVFKKDPVEYVKEHGNLIDKARIIFSLDINDQDFIDEIVGEIEEILNPEGGVPFDFEEENPSCLKDTAELLTPLSKIVPDRRDLIEKMASFIADRQKADGGFAEVKGLDDYIEMKWGAINGRDWYPVGKSITWLTGKAIEALISANYNNEKRIKRGIEFLKKLQHNSGHWPDTADHEEPDPLATGNIINAFKKAGLDKEEAYIKGRNALIKSIEEAMKKEEFLWDLVDIAYIDKPLNKEEEKIIKKAVKLIIELQNEDGGWKPVWMKQSDPELTALLVQAVIKHKDLI